MEKIAISTSIFPRELLEQAYRQIEEGKKKKKKAKGA